MTTDIKLIKAEETFSLRHKILRPHQALDECFYPGDNSETSFHLGLFSQNSISVVASFYRESHALFPEPAQFRLRGMATDLDQQGQGLGKLLLQKSFEFLNDRQCKRLWCNAREIAFPFYLKQGFALHGDFFEISGIGMHKIMSRII
jgi:GNAT superfamily N-acetyltransferase